MRTIVATAERSQVSSLINDLARRLMVTSHAVLPFPDFDDFMPELLKLIAHGRQRLVCGGHVTPNMLIAADKAEMSVEETLSASPFTLDAVAIRSAIQNTSDIVYLANPNRVTGANLGLQDLRYLAEAVPDGFLIIDECYFDYYGISGLALLEKYPQVIIFRSLTAPFGVGPHDSGYIVASPTIIEHMTERISPALMPATKLHPFEAALENEPLLATRLVTLHDEMLRVSTALTRLGVQNRISAADFLLIRVASPAEVGNSLAARRLPFDNLDGYPQLKHYVRYRVQTEAENDELIAAFSKMPLEYYRMAGVDARMITLRRPSETIPLGRAASRSGLSQRVSRRSRSLTKVEAE